MTTTFDVWLSALPVLLVLALGGWLISLAARHVNVQGALWPVMVFVACVSYALDSDPRAPRLASVPPLVVFWAARHFVYLVIRHERVPREHPGSGLAFSNLCQVFAPQALLAWVVSLPLLGAFTSTRPTTWLDDIGLASFGMGVLFEPAAGWLARYRGGPAGPGQLLARITRDPNYIGEVFVWWGFGCIAGAAGAWWALPGPLLMTGLALSASHSRQADEGGKGRPRYADYVLKTNVFFPARRRN